MIDFCREIGVFVANPHVNNVEGGGRYRADNVQLLAKQRYDPKGLLNPGQDDHISTRSCRGRAKTMKTWIPDARNFAYLNWKQVDALPRESTLLVLPTAAIEQHGHHLPLATDTLINNLLLGHALEKLPAGSAGLRAAAGALRQEQRAHRFSRNAFGERLHVHGCAARSRRELVERRLPESSCSTTRTAAIPR